MTDGSPTGAARAMIDRAPPDAAETRGASVGMQFGETSRVRSNLQSLVYRSGTAHRRFSGAGNWVIPDCVPATDRKNHNRIW